MEILDGISVKKAIDEEIIEITNKLSKKPIMASIRVGQDYGSIYYEKSLVKKAESLGVEFLPLVFEESITTSKLLKEVESLNNNVLVKGILIFFPLPSHIDGVAVKAAINPEKDIDCINPVNEAKIYANNSPKFFPATALAVIKLCEYYKIDLESKNVVIIGRSTVVGKPLAMMCLAKNATVTIAHSRTKNLKEISKKADIVIVAIGKAHFINDEYVGNNKQIFIDVGINQKDNKTVGDINYESMLNKVGSITPVPKGVGSITSSLMFLQCVL